MLLDEVFSDTLQVKTAWVRKDGNLRRVMVSTKNLELPKTEKPLFPIKSPRYGPQPNDNYTGYKTPDRIDDGHEEDQ